MEERLSDKFRRFKHFDIDDVSVIESPTAFYQLILDKTRTSERVYLACLVLGSDETTAALLDALEERMRDKRPTLLLVDKSRSMRDGKLIQNITDRGLWKIVHMVESGRWSFLPRALNELLGVYHLKAYIFDDEVCLSGANLNGYYFTNRIDRYYLVRNKSLCSNMLRDVFNSYVPDIIPDIPAVSPSLLPSKKLFTKLFKYTDGEEIGVLKDLLAFKFIEVVLTTAYLNFSSEHIKLFSPLKMKIVAPDPRANTFNDFSFLGQVITDIYAYSNYKTPQYLPLCEFHEYFRPGYSFHTKGVWLFGDDFCATIVGSSNYNRRSVQVDEECNWVILSDDPKLRAKFKGEVESVMAHSRRITKEELASRRYKLITILIFFILNILI